MIHADYPDAKGLDEWCDSLLAEADRLKFKARVLNQDGYSRVLAPRHSRGNTFVEFTGRRFGTFYGYWQPAYAQTVAPLLVHVPGYGAEMSAHPELVSRGFNVLHINPQGYMTPEGPDISKLADGEWPVLPDVVSTQGRRGYRQWLRDALVAIQWAVGQACVDPRRIGVFGSSQGGGCALLLGSLLRSRGLQAVAADVPFLTNFPMVFSMENRGAYRLAYKPMQQLEKDAPAKLSRAWRALGFVDTLSHAHRLTMPVLLTAGGADSVCPPSSIQSLFDRLAGTRSYTFLAGHGHAYTPAFLHLAASWFGMFV